MDRLHAYLYFLEGLMPVLVGRQRAPKLAARWPWPAHPPGVGLLHDIEPEFARADVYAQLLRIRILADAAGVVPLDREAAAREARSLANPGCFADPRIDGGYWFGRRNGAWVLHVNRSRRIRHRSAGSLGAARWR